MIAESFKCVLLVVLKLDGGGSFTSPPLSGVKIGPPLMKHCFAIMFSDFEQVFTNG